MVNFGIFHCKLKFTSDDENKKVLMDDKVLDLLVIVGYYGVPSRVNKYRKSLSMFLVIFDVCRCLFVFVHTIFIVHLNLVKRISMFWDFN